MNVHVSDVIKDVMKDFSNCATNEALMKWIPFDTCSLVRSRRSMLWVPASLGPRPLVYFGVGVGE